MIREESEQDYQDPLLIPGNLRKIVQNLPGKSKGQEIDYDYYNDIQSFEAEINEFFNYTEVTIHLQDYRRLYEKEFKSSPNSVKDIIMSLLNQLENLDQDIRIKTCRHLVHISINSIKSTENDIIQNNNVLLSCNCFHILYQKLQSSCLGYHKTKENQLSTCTEIDLYLTLIYILIETQRIQYRRASSSKKFKEEIVSYNPNLIELLFSTIARTRENADPNFPIKKAVLVLWKSMLFVTDELKNVQSSKKKLMESLGLDHNKHTFAKSTPQDMLSFESDITRKYPGFTPSSLPIHIISPLTLTASKSLSKAMGYSHAQNKTELLYHTLFPPKSLVSSSSGGTKRQYQLQDYFANQNNFPLPLPLTTTGLDVPKSIQEAGDAFVSNMHVSLSNFQIIQERTNAIQKWQNLPSQEVPSYQDKTLMLIERIYATIVPDLQDFIVVILKLLLATSSVNNQKPAENSDDDDDDDEITLEYLNQVDAVRNKEIISKAISGTLLCLLKWTKVSHALKFEYVSQLLVDSGCLLLILKMVGQLQEFSTVTTDLPEYGVFDYNRNRESDHQPKEETKSLYWTITLLRILQMLTKHKAHRIMLMVQYKSAAILKRLLKVNHPVLELYVLKLLKSQVPYLGKKWRTQNMKTISAIYLNCKTVLKDDWVSRPDGEEEEDWKMHEQNIRILTQIYHHNKYNMPLPIHDEIASIDGPGLTGFIQYDLDKDIDYGVADELDYGYDVTPAPCTPPRTEQQQQQQPTLNTEELFNEINKLYTAELNSEFKQTSEKLKMDQIDMAALQENIVCRLFQVEEKAIDQWRSCNRKSLLL